MTNEELVLKTMTKAGKPLKAGEIAEQCGLDKKDIDRAMNELKKTKQIISPKRCFWTPAP